MISVSGHFGEILQGRLGPQGPVVLVTLPCPALQVSARRVSGSFGLWPARGAVSVQRLRALLEALDLAPRGRYLLRSSMPVGAGAGASTAGLVALAGAAGVAPSAELMRHVLAIEGASDPLVFARAERLLWASRQGEILMQFPPLPRFEVLGGFWGPPMRTDPGDSRFPDVADLVQALPGAGLQDMARIAATSARRTLALRGPQGDPTEALARRFGALGFQIAHTGSARGLIFAPGTVPDAAVTGLRAAGFCQITRFKAGGR